MKKIYLLTPGPTPIPPEVLQEEARPIIHHRTAEYRAIFRQATDKLKQVFRTASDPITLTSSGTGAMEAAVINVLSKGDKAIIVRGGKFGERWGEICEAYGIGTVALDCEWGSAVDPQSIEELLANDKDDTIKAVFTTLCETSTGVLTDVKAIAAITQRYDRLLAVDAISALGADDINMDDWGIDILVSGSQKALMLPPGLGFICLSARAWEWVATSNLPKFYLDLKKYKTSIASDDTPWTPAISLVRALNKSLDMILQDGIEVVIARSAALAAATRAAMTSLGLVMLSASPANTLTAVKVPDGIDGATVLKKLRSDHGVWVAGGQAHLKGKILRIAHMGYITTSDLVGAIVALEAVLNEMGLTFELGTGVAAFEKALFQSPHTASI